MRYNLRNGHSVTTRKLPGDRTEFELTNPAGEVISNTVQERDAARETIVSLRVAAGLRRLSV